MNALNLNDFRSVIGANNYGEVRLGSNGGLEKINNHFLQRWGICQTKPDRAENILIRQMFADAIKKSGISEYTVNRLLERLGIGNDLSATSDLAGQPLKRADIKAIIADLDGAKIEESAIDNRNWSSREGPGMATAFHRDGATWLEEKINAFNVDHPAAGGKINLNSTEVKILCDRHRADIIGLMREAKDEAAFMTKLKTFIADKTIKEGESKFSGKASAARGVAADLVNSGCFHRQTLILRDGLHVKADHSVNLLTNDAEFRRLTLAKEAFDTFPIFNSKIDAEKYLQPLDLKGEFMTNHGEKLNGMTEDEKKCVQYVCMNAQNFVRNPIKVSFGNIKLDLAGDLSMCQKAIVDFLAAVKREHSNLPFVQFFGVCKVFNQTYYNTPKAFGMKGFFGPKSNPTLDIQHDASSGRLTVTGTFKKDSEDLRGKLVRPEEVQNANKIIEETPDTFKSVFTVEKDGTAQYQFAGGVKNA